MARDLGAILGRLKRETGLSYKPVDFPRRLRIQKSVYLLKALGYDPAEKYSFNLYVSGPYAPNLARHYYELRGEDLDRIPPAEIPERYLAAVKDAAKKGNRFLEAVASLHLIAHSNPRAPVKEVFGLFYGLKPALRDKAEGAWQFLGEHGLLREPT